MTAHIALFFGILALAPAACGSVESAGDPSATDGGPVEPDAAPEVTGQASIQIALEGSPAADLAVAFHDRTGAVIAEAVTDSSGQATAEIGVDGMVSVQLSDARVLTLFDVQPFDSLRFSTEAPLVFAPGDAGQVVITSADTLGSGNYYRPEVGSDNFITQNTSPLSRTLLIPDHALDENGAFDVIVIEYNTSDRPSSYGFVLDVTPDPDGSTAVDVPTPFSSFVRNLSISVSNAPADASSLRFESYNRIDGQYSAPSWFQTNQDSVAITAGAAAVSIPYIGLGDVEAVVRLPLSRSANVVWVRRRPRPAPAFALDGADMPPRLVAAIDSSAPERPRLTWSADGDPSGGDAIMTRLAWTTGATRVSWIGFVPPTASTAQVPQLPASWSAAPRSISTIDSGSVAYVDLESRDGYAELRGRIELQPSFELVPENWNSNEILPEGETGFVYSEVVASGAD